MIRVGDALGSYMRSLRLSSIAIEEEDEGEENLDLSGRHDGIEDEEDAGGEEKEEEGM